MAGQVPNAMSSPPKHESPQKNSNKSSPIKDMNKSPHKGNVPAPTKFNIERQWHEDEDLEDDDDEEEEEEEEQKEAKEASVEKEEVVSEKEEEEQTAPKEKAPAHHDKGKRFDKPHFFD